MRTHLAILTFGLLAASAAAAPALKTKNVVLVTLDGLRWQEVFRGADTAYINQEHGGISEKEQPLIREEFLAGTVAERRQKLMPFFWGEIAAHGQLYGNRDDASPAQVMNAEWFSYPGYNELLTGCVDPMITSNLPLPNRNGTILAWLDAQPAFAGRVVACTTWQVFPAILAGGGAKFPHWVTGGRSRGVTLTPRLQELDQWMRDIPAKSRDEHYDAFAFRAAMEFIDTHAPRVLYLAMGEADTNGHGRRYDKYLDSIRRSDRFIHELWDKLQSLPQYRNATTLIVTTDHGRGATPADWTNHSKKTPNSNETWLVILGPDTPALGERQHTPLVKQTQVAATIAQLLGEDYRAAVPAAGEALPEVFPSPGQP